MLFAKFYFCYINTIKLKIMKTMRFYVFFLVLALGAAFTSCSDDDEGASNTIVGAWQSVLHSYRVWVFDEDGRVYSTDETGTYRISGDKLHITWTDEYGDYDEDFLIVELTLSKMTLDELDDETGLPNDDPESFTRIMIDEDE